MIIYKLNTIPKYESAVTVVHVNEGEYGGKWVFEIVEGDSIFDLSGGTPEVTLNILKADKNVYSDVVEGGMDSNRRVTVNILEQMTASAGKAVAELVFSRSGEKKATANFIIDVERSPVNMGGHESASLINYVERNREAAEAATEAAYAAADATQDAITAAQEAAESANASRAAAADAEETAAQAMDNVRQAITNIQNMPTTIQNLASTLATAGAPENFLGFDKDGDAGSFDLDIVTPQMFGAKGDGVTYDDAAFNLAAASGKRVIVPGGQYKLEFMHMTDDSIILHDAGTYTEKAPIISRAVRHSAPVERFIMQFNASSDQATLHLRGACYDSKRDRIVAAFVTGRDETADASSADLVIKVYDAGFNEITGGGKTLQGRACVGGICYNSKKDRICVATGAENGAIELLNPSTFAVASTVNWGSFISGGCARRIAYDSVNDVYYVVQDYNDNLFAHVISGDFDASYASFQVVELQNELSITQHLNDSAAYLPCGGTVYNGQYLQLFTSDPDRTDNVGHTGGGAFICQYNYSDHSLKKAYRIGTNYYNGEEARDLINVNGKIFCLSNISKTSNQNYVSVTQLTMDERIDGDYNGVYRDAKTIDAFGDGADLNDYLGVGCYVSPTTTVTTGLSNVPTSYPFIMWVTPIPATVESRMQVLATYHGEIFVRTYVAHVSTWYGWRQLAEGPRKGTAKSGVWDGAGYITANGTEIRFTIPLAMPSVSNDMPTITVGSLRINARQNGNYLITSDSDLVGDSDYEIAATPGPFGINMIIRKTAAYTNVVNNESCGVGCTVTLRFA